MQPFQQEQGDQGCPNLDAECVLAGADEGFHGQVLLERFEKQFNFPALFVDGRDRRGAEFQQIGSRTISHSLSASQTTTRRRSSG
jgi:hypothetical protein